MPYEPKFKTGYTCETNGKGEGRDMPCHNVIIIDTKKDIYPHSDFLNSSDNDNSDEYHTLYATWDLQYERTWWYYSSDLETYCTNDDKGRKILLEKSSVILGSYGIHKKVDEFKQRIFGKYYTVSSTVIVEGNATGTPAADPNGITIITDDAVEYPVGWILR